MTDELITICFDGGSRGNPGPAGIGVVLRAADGTPVVTLGRYIGRATNNVAEYRALITGLEEAKKLGAQRLLVRGDSELVIKQMRGEYRVKNPDMRNLYDEAQFLVHQFDEVRIEHNVREHNVLADKLANLAMDRRRDVSDADAAEGGASAAAEQQRPTAAAAGERFVCPLCGCAIEVHKPSGVRPHQLRAFVCQCGAKMDVVVRV